MPELMKRGCGYVPDSHDTSKDPRTNLLFGSAISVPSDWSMEQFADDARDQLTTEECVGFGLGRAIHVRARAEGAPIEWPSTQAIYTWARLLANTAQGLPPDSPIQDVGCSPSLAVAGMTRLGVPSEGQWPFDPATVNDVPPNDAARAGSIYRVLGYHRVLSDGPQRLAEIRQALAHNYPVAVGVQIDKAFVQYNGSRDVQPSNQAELVGGHMTCLLGYDSQGRFEGINSWGKSWGLSGSRSGWYLASGEWLLSPCVGDIIVVTGELVPPGEVLQ